MANFAVLDGESIINTIVAESKTIAESVTGKTCVKYTTEPAGVGGTYSNGKFIQNKPYPSWISDGDSGWIAPVAHPEIDIENPKNYAWNENTVSWDEVAIVE
jgi:hypothetical protein